MPAPRFPPFGSSAKSPRFTRPNPSEALPPSPSFSPFYPVYHLPDMSATADPPASGVHVSPAAPAEASSRLEQPNDAVAMQSVSQSADQQQPSTEGDKPLPSLEGSSTDAAPPPDSEKRDQAEQPVEAAMASKADDGDNKDAAPRPPTKERSDSVMAIGPAQDDIRVLSPDNADVGPVCCITLLLTSGARHPYRIDAKYLNRRNVSVPEETENGLPDPFSVSIYTLKELILREWRSDWEAKPASPTSIRLIHFGKLLEDKEPLRSMHHLPSYRSTNG